MNPVFPGEGEMATRCRSVDWSRTSLGPVEEWPVSLRTLGRAVLTSRHPMLLFWGPELVQIYNDAYRPSLGGASPPGLGASARRFWADIWDVMGPQVDQVLQTGEATWHEDQLVPIERDGRREDVWWTYGYSPAHDDEGEIAGVLIVCQETTRRVVANHQTEAAAREVARAHRRLLGTLESMTDAFYLLDASWRFRFMNAGGEKLLSRSRREVLGTVVWESFPQTVGTRLEEEYRGAMESGRPARFRYHYPPLDRWFDISAYPSEEGLAVYFRDVTRDREAEQQLREQAELLELASDAIIVRDLEHRILYWNESAERVYGWPARYALGKTAAELLYDEEEPLHAATARLLEAGKWAGEVEHVARDGRRISVESRWSLVRNEQGEPARILAINTDVTERRKLQSQFLRAQRLESIGTLAGGIAHDLNNVLAPILMSIDLMREDTTNPDILETLESLEASAHRGSRLVRQVLAFARGLDGARVPVELERIVDELARVIRDTFPRSIDLQVDVEEGLQKVRGDPTQVHQVLLNLLVNARDAMPDGGALTLRARNVVLDEQYAAMSPRARPGPHVRVTVEDSGVGMTREVMEQIFDPFFTTKAPGEGTGLGLSTADAIMRSHGGVLNVYSERGKGTTFRAYFPADPAEGGEVAPTESTGSSGSMPRGKGERILVVDDDRGVREVTRQMLEAFGYRVLVADHGGQALEVARRAAGEAPLDLVLTDVMMPVMDGIQLVEALAKESPGLPVVVASGLGNAGHRERLEAAGVTHYLSKPYTARRLLAVFREVFDGIPDPEPHP
ncbi:MAG: PAS domain S-box protein [Gemmatimonadales bacterium]|nr:MAG: PAS domain S-box protein [Gemmatimonadales bacterium]